mmetsp:Transcript_17067/g.41534  ORF Transcript_17067/g.41534 Transcript_17067/m.41534 type:complete len:117 (+) Transcript_17067:946-1296(+)
MLDEKEVETQGVPLRLVFELSTTEFHGQCQLFLRYATIDLPSHSEANTLVFRSFFFASIVRSAPTAAVAEVNALSKTKARIGLKSKPKIGGIMFRNRFKYGSVIWKIGWRMPTLCA